MQQIYSDETQTVWAGYSKDGQVALTGQNLGGHPIVDRYEYFIRVGRDDFPTLRQALDGGTEDDVLDLVVARGSELVATGEGSWLRSHGVSFHFSNWGH